MIPLDSPQVPLQSCQQAFQRQSPTVLRRSTKRARQRHLQITGSPEVESSASDVLPLAEPSSGQHSQGQRIWVLFLFHQHIGETDEAHNIAAAPAGASDSNLKMFPGTFQVPLAKQAARLMEVNVRQACTEPIIRMTTA